MKTPVVAVGFQAVAVVTVAATAKPKLPVRGDNFTTHFRCCAPEEICKKTDDWTWLGCFSTDMIDDITDHYNKWGFYARTPDFESGSCRVASFIKGPKDDGDPSAIWSAQQHYVSAVPGFDKDGVMCEESTPQDEKCGLPFDQISLGFLMNAETGDRMTTPANGGAFYAHDSNACDKRYGPRGQHPDGWIGSWVENETDKYNNKCKLDGWEYVDAIRDYTQKRGWGLHGHNWEDDMSACYFTQNDFYDSKLSTTQNSLWYAYQDGGKNYWRKELPVNHHGAPQYWGWNEIAMNESIDKPEYWRAIYLKLPTGAKSLWDLSEQAAGLAPQIILDFWAQMNDQQKSKAGELTWVVKSETEDASKNYKSSFFCQSFIFQEHNGIKLYMRVDENGRCKMCGLPNGESCDAPIPSPNPAMRAQYPSLYLQSLFIMFLFSFRS